MLERKTQSFISTRKVSERNEEGMAEADLKKRCARPPLENKFPAPAVHAKTYTISQVADVALRLNNSHPGDVLVFQEGTYNLNLQISQAGITLKAADNAVVNLVSEKAPVLELSATTVRIERLNLVCKSESHPAVIVARGTAELTNCDIHGVLGGVEIRRGDPTFLNCKIHDSRKYGLSFLGSSGRVENCQIWGNHDAGILVEQASASPWVSGCTLSNGKGCGIAFIEYSRGYVVECKIANNACPGVYVTNMANPIVWKCEITGNLAPGVSVDSNGRGLFVQSTLYSNASQEVEVMKRGDPVVRFCMFKNGHGSGISVTSNSMGTFEHNILDNFAVAGIVVSEHANPTVSNNTFHYGDLCSPTQSAAILVHMSGQGIFRENLMVGWQGREVLRRPSIWLGRKGSLAGSRRASAETTAEGKCPILVRHGSTPEISNNMIA